MYDSGDLSLERLKESKMDSLMVVSAASEGREEPPLEGESESRPLRLRLVSSGRISLTAFLEPTNSEKKTFHPDTLL